MMKTFTCSALLLAAVFISGCAPLTPPPRGESIRSNLVYTSHPTGDEHLDLYLPAGKGPFPTVVWIHGGGWKYGDKGWMLYVRKITREGFAIASVQYRLSSTAKYPAQLEDCRAALCWVRKNGVNYGLDPHHLFLAGASAGGHLAAMLALEEGAPEIKAAFLLYPATDLTGFPNKDRTRGYLPELLGGSVNQKRALAEEGSPVNHVRGNAPPFLIFHGDKDTLVPIEQSEKLNHLLHAAGIESHFIVVQGKGHGFALTDAQQLQVAQFFQKHMH